jgi:hypothetical protein
MKNLEEIKAILGQVKSLVKEKYHVSVIRYFWRLCKRRSAGK